MVESGLWGGEQGGGAGAGVRGEVTTIPARPGEIAKIRPGRPQDTPLRKHGLLAEDQVA